MPHGYSLRHDMLENCRRICVIGAGTMGSGIAAHFANLGFEVTVLEVTREMAEEKLAQAAAARPPHFYLPATAKSITVGSIGDDLEAIENADWICEAIVEKIELKQNLFAQIEPYIREDALISTNTSGLEISRLLEGRTPEFRRKFIGTHFFNPPRYLKLLELIPTDETDPQVIEDATQFFETQGARRVVLAKDTPGFIANRYGMWCMFHAIHTAERLHLDIEAVDAITGPFLGRPKSGSFRLNDLVGLDIMADIAQNLIARCPDDPYVKQLQHPPSLQFLIEKGWIGNKVGQGYYRKEGNQFVALDMVTRSYREVRTPELPALITLGSLPLTERIQQGLQDRSEVGEFLRLYLTPMLQYAAWLQPRIAHNVRDFDRVMKWGFGWEVGPFELADMIGDSIEGYAGPFYQADQALSANGTFQALKPEPEFRTIHDFEKISTHEGFEVRDLGDDVHAIVLTTKMGTIGPPLVSSLLSYLDSGASQRFVLTSANRSFSAGFDLRYFVSAIEAGEFDQIEQDIANFQLLNTTIGQIPSVAAVFGHCLGGGFELAAGCTRIAALAETQIGLPEVRVGLVPGGAGIGVMRLRSQSGGAKAVVNAARLIGTGQLSANADEARGLGFLRPEDVTIYHPDRLLTEAKQLALDAGTAERPAWIELVGPLRGMIDRMQDELKAGDVNFTEYDEQINDKVKHVITTATSFEQAVELERKAFLDLCREGRSLARMRHMIEHGKPLRN